MEQLTDYTAVDRFEVQYAEDISGYILEQIWQPEAIHSCVGTHLVDDHGRHVAWVGAFRQGKSPRLPRRVASKVTRRCAPYRDLLIALHRMSATDLDSATAIVDVHGEPLLACKAARKWFALPGFREALAEDLSALRGDGARAITHFRSAGVTLTRVHGELGEGFVVTITPETAAEYPSLMTLSRSQRAVAELAGLGFGIEEIAKRLNRSRETVRTHMRAVYEVLGISTRAELALALAEVS